MPMLIFGRGKFNPNEKHFLFRIFRNEEERENGLKLLTGWTYRGNRVEVTVRRIDCIE